MRCFFASSNEKVSTAGTNTGSSDVTSWVDASAKDDAVCTLTVEAGALFRGRARFSRDLEVVSGSALRLCFAAIDIVEAGRLPSVVTVLIVAIVLRVDERVAGILDSVSRTTWSIQRSTVEDEGGTR